MPITQTGNSTNKSAHQPGFVPQPENDCKNRRHISGGRDDSPYRPGREAPTIPFGLAAMTIAGEWAIWL
jgi:hypothetical protein